MVLYRNLRGDEIRVLKLLTGKDDPKFASGPIHCNLEYVSLERAPETDTNDDQPTPTKGFSNSWASSLEDIQGQPGWQDGLWRKSARKRHTEVNNKESPSSNLAGDVQLEDIEAQLPWRYDWGDYIALSYVWGDTAVKRKIFVDNEPMAITQNLEAALCQLRDTYRIKQGFRIWADAICINQDDLNERAKEVAKMKHIYASAWHVVVWLGEASDDSDLAMIALRYFGIRSYKDHPLEEVYGMEQKTIMNIPYMPWKRHSHTSLAMNTDVFRALYHFLARPYFRRLWVLQEIASGARSTPVLCGTKCVLLDDVYRTLQLVRDEEANKLGIQIMRFMHRNRRTQRSWENLPASSDSYTQSESLWKRPIAMIEAQDTPPTSGGGVVNNRIFNALVLSRGAKTGDDRDRIYGILGYPCLAGVIKIVPNYDLTALSTYIAFAKSLFRSGDLNCLRLVASPVSMIDTKYFNPSTISGPPAPKFLRCPEVVNSGCEHDLPSWVTCWSCPGNPAMTLRTQASSVVKSSSMAPIFRGDRQMIVRGVLLGTINSLSAFNARETDRSYPFNGPEIRSAYGSEDETADALWRTITANTTISGTTPPAHWSTLLRNWIIDKPARSRRKMFGLHNFFARNKSFRLFDQTLAQLLNQKSELGPKLRASSSKQEFASRRVAVLCAMQTLAWRRLITTNEGYVGLAPAATRAGDSIAFLPGCRVPLALRAEGNCFRVLGESYVHGMMSGEVTEMLKQGRKEMTDITLC